jgi:hypothetical protein
MGPYGSVRGARGNSRPYRESGRPVIGTTILARLGHVVNTSYNWKVIINLVVVIISAVDQTDFDSPCSFFPRRRIHLLILNRLMNIKREIRFFEQTTAHLFCTCHLAVHRTTATV